MEKTHLIEIDGSIGEGGGQVLRTALTLSLITGIPILIRNIRSGRKKPGLQAQHLQAVIAAAKISGADIEGAHLESTHLTFQPHTIIPGRYRFDIHTAGSTSLVLQTIFFPLALANSYSSLIISGGTHVPWSPCFQYLDLNWMAFLRKIGFVGDLILEKSGFYPAGGGLIRSDIQPVQSLRSLQIEHRGQLKQIRGISAVANLDRRIAERQRNRVLQQMGDRYPLNDIRIKQLVSSTKGTFLLLIAEFEYTQCCYFALGELGKPAEQVADEAIKLMLELLSTQATVDFFLADQILLPLAISSGTSIYLTPRITTHLITNAKVIELFLPVRIEISGELNHPGKVKILPNEQ
jgi:RNA 3'-terminal phosphate cyclase (ATP)